VLESRLEMCDLAGEQAILRRVDGLDLELGL
jgi:hypothetical protein